MTETIQNSREINAYYSENELRVLKAIFSTNWFETAPEIIIEEATREVVTKALRAASNIFTDPADPELYEVIVRADKDCKGKPRLLFCLFEVLFDHGQLSERDRYLDFARVVVFLGVGHPKAGETPDQCAHRISNSICKTIQDFPPRYREWGKSKRKYQEKCESLARFFPDTMPYKWKERSFIQGTFPSKNNIRDRAY